MFELKTHQLEWRYRICGEAPERVAETVFGTFVIKYTATDDMPCVLEIEGIAYGRFPGTSEAKRYAQLYFNSLIKDVNSRLSA